MDVVPLPNGNVVVTAPFQDVSDPERSGAVLKDAGAVYLFITVASTIPGVEPKAVLVAELRGKSPGDRVGSGGVVVLESGDYVVASPHWDRTDTPVEDAGAVTWRSGSVSSAAGAPSIATVSTSNSLYGGSDYDWVGISSTYDWARANPRDNGYGDSQTSPDGYDFVINDPTTRLGSFLFDAITPLRTGNYVVTSPYWDPPGTAGNSTLGAGAVTLARADGTVRDNTGMQSAGTAVSITNSLYGSHSEDFIGSGAILDSMLSAAEKQALGTTLLRARGVTPVSTGTTVHNYVVASPLWRNDTKPKAGAVTWIDGVTGATAAGDIPGVAVSVSNSLYGELETSRVGGGGITPLVKSGVATGSYVVNSPLVLEKRETPGAPGGPIAWVYAVPGAVTWIDDRGRAHTDAGPTPAGVSVSPTNSLFGVPLGENQGPIDSFVGIGAVRALPTGAYVVSSPNWNARMGAASFGPPLMGVRGHISSANSLVGMEAGVDGDRISIGGVFSLSDGSYVVSSPMWNARTNNALTGTIISHVGAATWFNAEGRLFRNDEVPGVDAGSSGGHVNPDPNDRNSWNSLTGASYYRRQGTTKAFGDRIGFDGITEVKLGDKRYYTVASSKWNQSIPLPDGAPGEVDGLANGCFGAVTLCDMTGRVVVVDTAGTTLTALQRGVEVTANNSLHGDAAGDYVGGGGVTALTEGNFVVASPRWRSGVPENDSIAPGGGGSNGGGGSPTLLGAATWVGRLPDNSFRGIASVHTLGGVTIDTTTSLVGSTDSDMVSQGGVVPLPNGNYVITSPAWGGQRGAVTWASGASGATGLVGSNRTVLGSTAADESNQGDRVGSGGVFPLSDGNYVIVSPDWNSQDQVLIEENNDSKYTRTGAVTRVWSADGFVVAGDTSPVAAVSGTNSLVGTNLASRVGSGGVTPVAEGSYVVHSPEFAPEVTASGTSTQLRHAVTWRSAAATGGVVSSRNSIFGELTAAGVTRDPNRGRFLVGINDPDDSPIHNFIVRGIDTNGFPPPAIVSLTAVGDTTQKGDGQVADATVTFSQPLKSIELSAVRLTRNDVAVPLDATVVKVTPLPGAEPAYRIAGLAGFNTEPGTYRLSVDATDLTNEPGVSGAGRTSTSWTVVAPAVSLEFVTPPTSHRFGSTFGFTTEVRSGDGSRALLFNGPVTVAVRGGPGELLGTATVAAVNGLVTFSGLRLSASGQYKLKVTNPFLQSTSIDISSRVEITDQRIYHLGSSFAAGGVDAALDPGKSLARPGSTAQALAYANLINGSRGLNGIVIDVAGLASTSLTAAHFSFRMSPQGNFNEAANPPSAWATAPAPSAIVVTAGTATTPARVRLEWADNVIVNRWLQIAVLASTATGLDAPEIFYVGHLTGETNGAISNGLFRVTNADYQPVAAAVGTTVTVGSVLDIIKDGRIRNTDFLAVSQQVGVRELRVITIPVAGSASHGTFGPGPSGPSRFDGTTRGGNAPGSIDFAALAAWAGATQPATQTDPANPTGNAKPKR